MADNLKQALDNHLILDIRSYELAEGSTELASVNPLAQFAGRLTLGDLVVVDRSRIGSDVSLLNNVHVYERATVEDWVLLDAGSVVGVGSLACAHSSLRENATLGAHSVLGPNATLPTYAEVGPRNEIVDNGSIMVLKHLDGRNLVTIYGTRKGARLCYDGKEMTLENYQRRYGHLPYAASFMPGIVDFCGAVQTNFMANLAEADRLRKLADRYFREQRA